MAKVINNTAIIGMGALGLLYGQHISEACKIINFYITRRDDTSGAFNFLILLLLENTLA